jgi:hypothetical protein
MENTLPFRQIAIRKRDLEISQRDPPIPSIDSGSE